MSLAATILGFVGTGGAFPVMRRLWQASNKGRAVFCEAAGPLRPLACVQRVLARCGFRRTGLRAGGDSPAMRLWYPFFHVRPLLMVVVFQLIIASQTDATRLASYPGRASAIAIFAVGLAIFL